MRTLYTIAAILAMATAAHAVDLSMDTSADKSSGKEKNMAIKNSIEKKLSTTVSKAHDSSRAITDKKSRSNNRDSANTITIPTVALLPDLGLRYLLPTDLGLMPELRKGGWINTTEQDYYNKAWASNAPITVVGDQAAIELYIDQIARTGLIAAQAQMLLIDRVGQLAGKKATDKAGKKVLDASGIIGIEDLPPLASQAWRDASKDVSSAYLTGIWQRYQDERKNNPCRLYGSRGLACGNVTVELQNPPRLVVGNVVVYDGGTFCGLTGDLKVSATTSLQSAYDKSKTVSDSNKNATDKLDAEGDSFEASMQRKQALNKSTGSKANISAGKFIPPVH